MSTVVCVRVCVCDNTTRVQYEQLNTVTKVAKQTKVRKGAWAKGAVVVVLPRPEHINSAEQSTLNSHFNGLPHCC